MDIVVQNVTNEYKKEFRIKEIIAGIFNLCIAVLLIIMCILPIGKIGETAVENGFEIIISTIKNIGNKEKYIYKYLIYYMFYSVGALVAFLIFLIEGIKGLKAEADVNKYYINEKYINIKISTKFIIKHILFFFAYVVLCVLFVWPTKVMAERYGFNSSLAWVYIILFVLLWVKGVVCGYRTLKYDECGSESRQELLDRYKTDKNSKSKGNKKSFDFFLLGIWALSAVFILFISVVFAGFTAFSCYTARFGGGNNLGFNSVAGWVISPDAKNLLRFDVKTLEGGYDRLVCEEGVGDYYIGLKMLSNGQYESNTKTFTFYGDAYRYHLLKIEELKKEMNELMPEDDGEKALEKYLEKMKSLYNSIQIIEDKLDSEQFPYERVAFENGYMVDLQYNATGEDEIKWGKKPEGLAFSLFIEKIKLTDFYCKEKKSMDTFAVGTDFSKELIVARVQYSDGSVRISKIKPTNVEELNNAKAGEHLLKWEDSWGEYQTKITIYNK